ncbi:DUF5675 family protein [Sinomicrobium oceani]|uniref:DUF5675 family protein n=1 Tax=Sinomicrobium oceani TaxID=1150368 RepID=UPI002DD448A3|nr:DUF5675 family protein [Sinomicrobium oceani]
MGTSVSFGDYSPGVLPVTIVVRTAYFARKKTEDIFEETTEEYTVVAGDNLSKIAGNYEGVSYQDIMEENGLNSTVISVGDTLTITSRKKTGEKTSFEKIKNGNAGDEVYIVAEHFGTVSSIQVTLKEKEALLTDGGTLPVLQDESEITTIELCEPEEENLKGTHRYAKVKLRPKEDETLEEWREKLGENEVMGYTDGQRSIPPESYDRMIAKEGWEPEYGEAIKSLLSIEVEARGEGEITYRGTDKSNVFLNKEGEWFEVKKANNVTIRLERKWETEISTIGEFMIDGTDIEGYILEEKGPSTTVSGLEQRVPVGTYNLIWHNGTRFKNVLKLYNDEVPVSRAILIHAGNSASDTEGCLLPGSSKSTDWVSGSKFKLKEINDHVKEVGIEDAKIIITENFVEEDE